MTATPNDMNVKLIVERFSVNKLAKADEYRREIAAAANKRSSAPNVTGKASKLRGPLEEIDDSGKKQLRYEFTVVLEKKQYKNEETARKHLEAARKFIEQAAEVRGWKVKGEAAEVRERAAAADARPTFSLPGLEQGKEYFKGIKERDAHIRLMYASVYTYRMTNGEERNHTLLYGDPAAAKSSLIKGFKTWFDGLDGVERVMQVNATTLSKAGLENLLLEKAELQMLPEILWINELEKGNADDFLCLLSVMDGLGEISRLNSKIGKRTAKCPILVWADCNDEEKIKNWNKGALWSRFNKRWPCVRPSRDVMTQILNEMVEERKQKGYPANKAWVPAAINYAFDVMGTNDPREIKGMLDGGDGLLDGSYFKDIEAIKKAREVAETAKQLGKLY